MSGFDIDEMRQVAFAMADAARASTLPHFRSVDLRADNKASGAAFDPVTAADRECEAAMRDVLRRMRPDDGVLGEEADALPTKSGLTWVLDPIDGTRAFLSGAVSWGVLIGLNDGRRPVMGVMDQPYLGERFFGAPGNGAWMERAAERSTLKTRQTESLADAILYSTFPEIGTDAERAAFGEVRDRVRLTRYGLDCYGYALIALGQIDLVVEAGLHPYDIQALIPIVEAAGGLVTNWRGGDCQNGGRVLAAANPALHAQAMALLAGAD